eukprot:Pgem_evm1s8368
MNNNPLTNEPGFENTSINNGKAQAYIETIKYYNLEYSVLKVMSNNNPTGIKNKHFDKIVENEFKKKLNHYQHYLNSVRNKH